MRISDWSSDVCSSDLRESSSAGTSIGRLRRASPSLPVPAASTFSTMSALLFDYTNDLIATLLGRHVDEHVGMILGDDAIHREGEWIGVRDLIECRQTPRPADRRVGRECDSTCRSRRSPDN